MSENIGSEGEVSNENKVFNDTGRLPKLTHQGLQSVDGEEPMGYYEDDD